MNTPTILTENKWYHTAVGQSVFILLLSSLLVILNALLSGDSITIASSVVGQFITFIPLTWFIYKKKRWSIVIAMILWIFVAIKEFAAYAVATDLNPDNGIVAVVFIFFAISMKVFINAFKEMAPKK